MQLVSSSFRYFYNYILQFYCFVHNDVSGLIILSTGEQFRSQIKLTLHLANFTTSSS